MEDGEMEEGEMEDGRGRGEGGDGTKNDGRWEANSIDSRTWVDRQIFGLVIKILFEF